MGQRRKGELPVLKQMVGWSADHPVAHSMARGSTWFQAWIGQMATPYARLAKMTQISVERIQQIADGATIRHGELIALAAAWWITPEGLLASMPDPERVIG
jgi:hypothetical protein